MKALTRISKRQNYFSCVLNKATQLALGILILGPAVHAELVSGELTGGSSMTNGGSFQLISAPATLGNNAFDDDNVRAFDEVQNLTLTASLIMDFPSPDLSSNVLGAGSIVSSHYVIYDPAATQTVEGTVTFDEPVLGIITSNLRFNDTDILLGNPATSYTIGNQELESSDTVMISGNTIEFSLIAISPGDAIRVITGVNPEAGINVCGPGTETLFGVITGGDALSNGGQFRQICDPIGAVGNDNFDSYDLFAFEEQQAAELGADLFIDATTIIEAGNFVSSFYVVWDPVPTNRVVATITFPDTIIGVIRDQIQLENSEFLGNASANYLNPSLLGLEAGDTATIDGNQLLVNFNAGTPGDSIRVILGSASPSLSFNICEPQDMTLSGSVTGGTAASAGGTFSQLCEPIGPVGNNNFQSNDLFAFEEVQAAMLSQPVDLDDPLVTLAAGTVISSYYVAFDPASIKDIVGSITFPGPILGIATSIDPLSDSDNLGNPTATYLNPSLRGLESGDLASFSGNDLCVAFNADSPGDYIRVIVAGEPVDTDGDGIDDPNDNCSAVANPTQLDTNGDGIGNACDLDLNNDCAINFPDLALMQSVFFTSDADADTNGDGFVNFIDLQVMKELFFGAPGPSGVPNDCRVNVCGFESD